MQDSPATGALTAAGHKRALRRHRVTAIVLALCTVALLVATAPDVGLTWDEPAYIAAAESYVAWFGALIEQPRFALSAEGIAYHWTDNHEHPPLDKVWSGLVWAVARHWTDDLTAHRLGNILLVGIMAGLLYMLAAVGTGRAVAGLAAVGALLTMPRFFSHAHLAALDVPAAAAVLAVTYLFWRTRARHGAGWHVLLGIAWGLALATKVNAVFVPPTLLLWMLLFYRRAHLWWRLVVAGLIGVPLSLAVWPWLYHDFWPRLVEYVRFVTIDHWKIGQWYLGRFYMPPPWHFVFVMAAAVVPLSLALLALIGVLRYLRPPREERRVSSLNPTYDDPQPSRGERGGPRQEFRALIGLLLLSALVPMLALASGQSMVYDNERLFMPTFPFLAALSGLGFDALARGVERLAGWLGRKARPAVRRAGTIALLTALAAICYLPHTLSAAGLYPHLLSYYSEALGGLPGAARLGLESTYWCETYAAALPYLNAHARTGATVWVEDWSHDVMVYYQLQGRLDPRLAISWTRGAGSAFYRQHVTGYPISFAEADFVVVQYRQTGLSPELLSWLQGRRPVFLVSHRGIPLMAVFAR